MTTPSPTPSADYAQRAEQRASAAARLDRRSLWLGNFKLAVVIVFFVAGAFYVKQHAFSPYWLLLPVIAFFVFVIIHDRVIKSRRASERAAEFYRFGLDRIADRWAGAGDPGEQFRVPDHIYADDLDLFGRGGLFELLCSARTPMGRQTLARWLLDAASADEIRARQQAIDELRSRLDFREDLAITGDDLGAPPLSRPGLTRPGGDFPLRPDWLVEWAESPIALHRPVLRVVSVLLALAAVAAVIYRGLGGDWIPLLIIVAVSAFIASRIRRRVDLLLDSISAAADELALVSALTARIEREAFTSPWLKTRAAGLETSGPAPSRSLERLRYL